MAAGQYSAGTIFLQVVPVFRDTMDRIQEESKKLSRAIGDDLEESGREGGKKAAAAYSKEMEKGSKDAGEKAGEAYSGAFEKKIKGAITSAQREMDRLSFSTASESSIQDLERVKRKLKELKDVDFTADFNAKKVLADVAIIEAAIKKVAAGDHEINITANAQKALADIRAIGAAAEAVEKKKRELRFEGKADFKAVERQIGTFEKKFTQSMRKAAGSLGDHLGPEIAKIRRDLESLGDVEIGIDMDAEQALTEAAILKAQLQALIEMGDVDLDLELDAGAAIAELAAFDQKIDAIERHAGAFEKKFSHHMRQAANSLGDGLGPEIAKIKARLESLADAEIGVDLDATEAMAQARGLKVAMEFLAGQDVDIDVDIDLGASIAQIMLLDKSLDKVQRNSVKTAATVGIMGAVMAAFTPRANAAGSAGENGANAFRSFNFVILAAVTLLPALVPVLAAVGGGLLALIPILGALGAGLGVAILGFSGIGGALREMGNVADEQAAAAGKAEDGARSVAAATHAVADAERSLADARRNAARAAADAERAVADARRNAARAIEAAYDRQKDAAEAYADAQDAVREAEEDLRKARADAEAEAADLPTRQRKNAVDERQAVMDLGEAQNTFNAVNADGSSTNVDKEQASINLEQAQIALNDIRAEQVELTKEAEDYAKNGVDGSEDVQSAQERVTEALERQVEAQEDVAEAAKETRRVQADAARDIADALRNQQRVAGDNARAIEDAQRALARAQEGQAQAVTDAAEEGSAAMDRLEVAMSKLSPAGRKFAEFLFGLRTGFREIRDEVQERMLPGVQRGLQAIIDEYGPKFKDFAGNVAGELGSIGESTGNGLGNKAWQDFFRTYGKLVPELIREFGEASGNWMNGWAAFFTTIAPYSERLSDALLRMSEHAEAFFTSAKGKKEVQEFMDYAFKVGPDVVNFFKDLAIFAKDLAKALAPLGELVLKGFNEFMEWISSMDPKNIQLIVTGLLGLVIAFQLAVGAVALVVAGSAIWSSWAALIIFAIVAVIAIVVALYSRFPAFRKIVDKALDAIGKAFNWLKKIIVEDVVPVVKKVLEGLWAGLKWAWENVIKPVLGFIGDAFEVAFGVIKFVWDTILAPILKALWETIKWIWEKVVSPVLGFIGKAFKLYFTLIKGYWNNILYPIFDLFGTVFRKLWENIVRPALQRMGEKWDEFALIIKTAWNTFIKPIFDTIADYIDKHVAPKFETAVGILKGIWAGLREAFAAPIRFVIDEVINKGLIAGFNWVANKVGSKPMGEIPIPEFLQAPKETSKATGGKLPWGNQSRAVGGVLPGYNPGRDNFTFYNPELGNLNLGGGEAILRPEVVRAAGGAQWVDGLNHAAMSGGVQGVQKKLFGSFAKGGIVFPVRGGYVNRSEYNLGHDGMDINHPDDASGRVPFVSATPGYVTSTGYARGYGNAVYVASPYGELVYGHSLDGTLQVSPGDTVRPGQWLANIGNTGNSSGPHLHFGFPGGTFYGAEALLAGSMQPGKINVAGGEPKGLSMPKWAKTILANPLEWMKGLVTKPLDAMREKFGTNDLSTMLTSVPAKLIKKSVAWVKDLIPPPGAAWDKLVGNGVDKDDTPVAPGPESGLPGQQPGTGGGVSAWKGGVLPYNGTMMYDAGGYLPPGLTTVMNLTGKPEPVFTADQFSNLDLGGTSNDGITYAPTFEGSNLTPADVVDDLDFTMRRIRREGRYGRSKL